MIRYQLNRGHCLIGRVIGLLVLFSLFSFPVLSADATLMQQLFVVKQAFPGLKTIGVLCHTEHAAPALKEMGVACAAYQIKLTVVHTATLQDVRDGFDKMVKAEKIDLIWVLPDNVTDQKFGRRFLSERCVSMKIPLIVSSVDYVREGALLSVGSDETGVLHIYLNQKVGQMMSLSLSPEVMAKVISIQ